MAYWQQRGAKRYLTQSREHDGRVLREYLGTGPVAEALYHVEAERQAQRQAEADAWHQTLADLEALDQQMAAGAAVATALLEGLLYAEGYYRHDRGAWRTHAAR